jgi:hypothetical protein
MLRVGSWLAVLAVAAAVVSQLFIAPIVGAADNGDFSKVTGWFDLANPLDAIHVARFADLYYAFDPKFHYPSGFYSSETLLAAVAVRLNRFTSPSGVFDLRVIGLVHAALFLLTWCLFVPLFQEIPPVRRYVALGLIAAVFTDVMYVAYLNSFFMDTASLLFLLLSVVAFLRTVQWERALDRWLLIVAAILLVTSKAQHSLLALPIAGLLLWTTHSRRVGWLAAVIVLSAGALSVASVPRQYPVYARYTTVFRQVLPKTQNPTQALRDLGLPEAYGKYIGTHAYSADTAFLDPQFADRFQHELSYFALGRFFLSHPADALRSIEDRLSEAGRQRSPLGNFPSTAGLPDFAQSDRFAWWSGLKARMFEQHGRVYLVYALLLALAVPVAAHRWRYHLPPGIATGAITLAVMLIVELLVAGLGDALDAARHFLLFAAMTDILLLGGVCLAMLVFAQTRR